jgi:hypothetical protein
MTLLRRPIARMVAWSLLGALTTAACARRERAELPGPTAVGAAAPSMTPEGDSSLTTDSTTAPTNDDSGATAASKSSHSTVPKWTCKDGNDSQGTTGRCADLKLAASCRDASPRVHGICGGAAKYFKPRIAERAVSCIRDAVQRGSCEPEAERCRWAALESACPDPAVDAMCTAVETKCPGLERVPSCREHLFGLNAEGRKVMIECMSKCRFGLGGCFYAALHDRDLYEERIKTGKASRPLEL